MSAKCCKRKFEALEDNYTNKQCTNAAINLQSVMFDDNERVKKRVKMEEQLFATRNAGKNAGMYLLILVYVFKIIISLIVDIV